MKRLLFMMLALAVAVAAQGQNDITKKCKTCGKPLKECQYRGRHPQSDNKPTAKPKVRMDGDDIVCTVDGQEYRYRMVYVSGGTFTMGAQKGNSSAANYDAKAYSDECPVHSVTLSCFYMGQTEVTQALWKAVMGSNPSYWKGNNLPVEMVSYYDCKEFIGKLNALTGQNFRLPTEAEWEYAARGAGSSRGYKYSGGDNLGSVAWYNDNSGSDNLDSVAWYEVHSGSQTHPVAQKQANELGLYDMSGNVWEWCSDWSSGDYYASSPSSNPKGPGSGSYRVLRGGGWLDGAWYCRVSCRNDNDPSRRSFNFGFRLALSR